MPPLFTIVIPTLNAAAKLPMTLESVLQQDLADFELLIVDGGSTDATADVVAAFSDDPRLRWELKPGAGIYPAMNRGIELARGRFLYFLGAGDLLNPGALGEVAAILPSVGRSFIYGNVLFSDGSVYDGGFWPDKLEIKNICHQAIFYERTLFEEEKFDPKYRILADWAFNMKCFGDRSVAKLYIEKVLARYEGGGVSLTSPDPDFNADYPQLIRRHLGLWQYAKLKGKPRLERWKRLTVGRARGTIKRFLERLRVISAGG